MSNKKKLLVMTSTFPRWVGDTEPPFVFELCRRLTTQFDIVVLAPHAKGSQFHEMIDSVEVRRFRYCFSAWERLAYEGGILSNLHLHPWRYLLIPGFFLSQTLSLYRILRKENIDVIHAHWLIPQALSAAIVSFFLKAMPPVLCTSHGGDILGLNGRLFEGVKRWVIQRIQYLTVVSNAMMIPARRLGATSDKLSVIPMGVDTLEKFVPSSSKRSKSKLLFIGRLVAKKGTSDLLAALPIVRKEFSRIELNIVGSGPEYENLKRQANILGITDAVHFLGAIDNADIPDFCRESTLLVMPSKSTKQGGQEGLGLVLVEALACGCPVIASNLPGVRDVVVHQHTGWLIPENNVPAIAAAVVKLLHEPELRERLASNGRAHVMENFDWHLVTSKYSFLIHALSEPVMISSAKQSLPPHE